MLHVGEVEFTPGSIFLFEIQVPFTSGWKLKISTPGWNGYFDVSAWHFSFYKNTDILITDQRSVVSCKLEKKENSCAYRFYVSRCCKYCLLALYSCMEHDGEIGKLKEALKYIHYFLFPSLTSNLFLQELGILNVNLTSQISTKRSLQ